MKTEVRRVVKSVVVVTVVVTVVVMVAGQMTGVRKKSYHHHLQESVLPNPIHKENLLVVASARISVGRNRQWKDVFLTDE